jgi:hypothetical protein
MITLTETTAQLMAAGIGIVGVLLGLVAERILRHWGWVWCEPAHHEVVPRLAEEWEGIKIATEPDEAELIDYQIRLDLYNGREVPVGLRDVRVVFKGSDGCVSKVPNDKAELLRQPQSGPPEPQMYAPLYVVNLPPRQWVVKEITGRLYRSDDPEETRLVFGWRHLEFAGERRRMWPFPSKKLRWVVATRPPAGSGQVPRPETGPDSHS